MSRDFSTSGPTAELAFLDRLRERYEAQGFEFVAHPSRGQLPPFMKSYIPDAIAFKNGQNIAIEIKAQRHSDSTPSLQSIRRLLETHPGWQLDIVFMASDPLAPTGIRAPSPQEIRQRLLQVRSLAEAGHLSPALIMAWSLLEATLNAIYPDTAGRPHRPATVLERLAMDGYITPELQRQLRDLIPLRNRLVHGDLDAAPRNEDVQALLSAIALTLDATEEGGDVL